MSTETVYLVDEFVTLKKGEAIRLFPFGKLVKNGKERIIDAELARKFSLPHFQPPVKLGSHDDVTPAGGFITELEVRETNDPATAGLWGHIEYNEEGEKALQAGSYRYHSPEVIWEGGFEDPQTGEMINGPLIIGDALLHTPHMGNATALYSVEPIEEKQIEQEDNIEMDNLKPILDKFSAWLDKQDDEEGVADVAELSAVATERDNLKAELLDIKENTAKIEKLSAVKAELDTDKFGAAFQAYSTDETIVSVLADMNEETREIVLGELKKLSGQIDESNLTEEIGKDAEGVSDQPVAQFDALVKGIMAEDSIGYSKAYEIAKTKHADVFGAFSK